MGSRVALGPRGQPSILPGAVARRAQLLGKRGLSSSRRGPAEETALISSARRAGWGRGAAGPAPARGTVLRGAGQARRGGAGHSPRPPGPRATRLAASALTSPPVTCKPGRPPAAPPTPAPGRTGTAWVRAVGRPLSAGDRHLELLAATWATRGRARAPEPDVSAPQSARAPETPSRAVPALPAAASCLTSA